MSNHPIIKAGNKVKINKKYLQKIKSLNEIIQSESVRCNKWMNYANDLNDKLDFALKRLETISKGHYYKDELSAETENKAEKTAIIALRKLSRMRERKI